MAGPFIFIFTGTSGSGRKTIAHRIGLELGICHVLSCTTRAPREQESHNRDYHYISQEQFAAIERRGEFIQTAVIGRERYGVRREELERELEAGRHVYLILNSEASTELKKQYGEQAVRIFIYVDKITMRERLERKGMPYDVVERYAELYPEEVIYRKRCEHVIENVDLNRTLDQIRIAIQSHL